MTDIKFEIVEELAVISENPKGWRKELNLVSWNNAAPKYDLRDWAPNHEKMGKGVTMTKDELNSLRAALGSIAGWFPREYQRGCPGVSADILFLLHALPYAFSYEKHRYRQFPENQAGNAWFFWKRTDAFSIIRESCNKFRLKPFNTRNFVTILYNMHWIVRCVFKRFLFFRIIIKTGIADADWCNSG